MSQVKRMIYVQGENLKFYNSLNNKSGFINECLKTARLGGVDNIKVTEVSEGDIGNTNQASTLSDATESMRERDARRLKDYRERKGLYDPVNNPRE